MKKKKVGRLEQQSSGSRKVILNFFYYQSEYQYTQYTIRVAACENGMLWNTTFQYSDQFYAEVV